MAASQPEMESTVKRKLRKEFDRFLLRRLPAFNASKSAFYVQFRPDFDVDYGRFEPAQALREAWTREMERNNWGDLGRLYFLFLNVQRLRENNVEGDFAEVGVFKGNSAKVLHLLAPERRLWLFDTFAGFADDDAQRERSAVKRRDFGNTSLDRVRSFLGHSPRLEFVPGKFPETAARVPEKARFALVHLDCDLHAPTLAGLEFFYPRLSRAGLLVVHDYASGHWPGVAQAVDEFLADKPEKPVLIPDKSGSAALVKV